MTPPPKAMPQPVKAAWYLWIAAAVVMVLGGVVSLLLEQRYVEQATAQLAGQPIKPEQIAGGMHSMLWTFLVGAIVFAVLFLLFAWKAKDGTRSARTVLTVLAVVTVVFQALFFSNEIKLLACAVIIAATVCLYLPSVRDYFPKLPKS